MQGSINQYLIRVLIFLILVFLMVVYIYPVVQIAFISNIYINSIIVLSIFFGLIFIIYNLYQIKNNYDSIASFNIHKSPEYLPDQNLILKELYYELTEIDGRYQFRSSRIEKIMEKIDLSLSSIRDTSKYLVGLLVFLGLLGTFWGLLKTIGSVGNVISGLGIDETNVAGFFNSLKDGLTAPLDGMSIAFSSSLLGLAGSLILGFVDLQLGQAQIKFSLFVEKVITHNSKPDFTDGGSEMDKTTLFSIQKIYDNLDKLVFSLKENASNQSQIFNYMKILSEQISDLNVNSRKQDKQLSSFLSTQINTQASIYELISELSKKGLIDKEVKKTLNNIEKGFQKLKIKSQKK